MKNDGKIRPDSLGTSGGFRSMTLNASERAGLYGAGLKGTPRRNSTRRAYPRISHSKMIGLLLVCAAVIVMLSAVALAPLGKEKASQPNDEARTLAPGLSHPVNGYTYDSLGALLGDCAVTVLDVRTGESVTVHSGASGPTLGFYFTNLQFTAWMTGDDIQVTAVDPTGTMTGVNTTKASGGFNQIDVKLDTLIPEFPMVILPITGMMAMFVLVSLKRRGQEL